MILFLTDPTGIMGLLLEAYRPLLAEALAMQSPIYTTWHQPQPALAIRLAGLRYTIRLVLN